MYLFLCTGPGLAPGFLLLFDNEGEVQTGRTPVSKAELGGSNPSARAKLCYASEAEVDIAEVS